MWFTENSWLPMSITGVCGLISLAVWNSHRHDRPFHLALFFFGLTGLIYAVERSIVTEGERLQEDVIRMCDEFRHHDPGTLEHFSDDAPQWKSVCQQAMDLVEVHDDLHLTDFRTNVTDQNSKATVHFRANATIEAFGSVSHHPFRCVLSYQKENGRWKIVDVQRLDPIRGEPMQPLERR